MVTLDKVKNPFMRKQLEETFTKYMGIVPISGNVFYVHGTDGSSSASGNNINSPLDTLDNAINNATANNGDVIFLLPGHTETYTTTGAKFIVDKAGITIIGVGKGADRPTISYGHTGTTGTISAASCVIANVLFLTAVDQVVTYGTISGADCNLIDCESRDVTDKEVVTDFTLTATADRFKAFRYFKNGYTGGDANDAVFSMAGVDNALISECIFMTKVLTAVIEFVTTACTNVVINNSVFYVNGTSLSKNVVDTITGSTWICISCADLSTGAGFSGGSGAALATDDTSAIATAVSALQTDVGDFSARTNLQTLLAVLGNPDAAGATTHSTIINSNPNYNSKLGTKVTRAAADIFDGSQTALFTVSGGRILVTHIEIEVTAAAIDAGASNTSLVTNPTVGTDAAMCAVLDINADEAGTIYSITGKPGDSLVGGSGGGAPSMETNGFIVPEGTIDLLSAADVGTGGALGKCEMWYIVLDSGASVAST